AKLNLLKVWNFQKVEFIKDFGIPHFIRNGPNSTFKLPNYPQSLIIYSDFFNIFIMIALIISAIF
ncbi:MAG: hypothetical protein ABFD00_05485, partial [Chloroherpetonaceae bacterium]